MMVATLPEQIDGSILFPVTWSRSRPEVFKLSSATSIMAFSRAGEYTGECI